MSEQTADRVAGLLGAEGPLSERYSIVGTLEASEALSRWRAEDREDQRSVVVTATTSPIDGSTWAAVEERLAMLRDAPHANIVEVVDFGEFEGLVWAVEHQVASGGETVGEMLERQGRLTLQELIPIVAQILKAYGHTHLRGLPVGPLSLHQIHLVERSNKLNFVRIERFGWANPLVKGARGDGLLTAPEDRRGATPSVEADVFILGQMMFELLAGARLDLDRLSPDGDGQPRSLEGDALVELVPEDEGVPPEFLALIESALAKRPEDRPVDANALVEELIDCIPMNMFRLPAKPGTGRAVPRSGENSVGSGSMILTGSWKAAAERQVAREERSGAHTLTESSDDLGSTGSRSLTSSQTMRSGRHAVAPGSSTSSASIASSAASTSGRRSSKQGGIPPWAVAGGAVALVAAGALAVFMIATGPGATANVRGADDDPNAAVDQVDGVAGSRQRTEAKGGRKGSGRDETATAEAPDEPSDEELELDRDESAGAADEEATKPSGASSRAKKKKSGSSKKSPRPAATDQVVDTAAEPADDQADAPATKKKKKKKDGLLTPGQKSKSSTKPSTKSSDAFLPPTGK